MIQPSDFTPRVLNLIATVLNQGYECEIKGINDKVVVLKVKRKLMYKVKDKDDIKKYLIDNVIETIDTNQDLKVEFKREREKVAIIEVKKVEMK